MHPYPPAPRGTPRTPVGFELPVADDPEAAELAATLTGTGSEQFLRAVAGAPVGFHHRSTEGQVEFSGLVPDEYRQRTSGLLLRAAHLCFTAHLPLSLSPDVLWYAVVARVLPDHEPGNELLPEGWTLTDLRRISGRPETALVTPLGPVTLEGAPLRARLVVDVGEVRLVQAEDGRWYNGEADPSSGTIDCWSPAFEDPGAAFRF
ncbi:hypothetical protein [Kitasatospora sp. NPDC002040]|uniref:hypothetical protein n=1 Tax=Kitasatospora sp. NPDC002040 TaxID=3154661 RepID=UPI0033244DC4